jgi:hypothetical protein
MDIARETWNERQNNILMGLRFQLGRTACLLFAPIHSGFQNKAQTLPAID